MKTTNPFQPETLNCGGSPRGEIKIGVDPNNGLPSKNQAPE